MMGVLAALLVGLSIAVCGVDAQITDDIDWQAYLSRSDPIWKWTSTCTSGYTEHATTIRHDSAPCPTKTCASKESCLEESASMCDACASCASFALSTLWHDGLLPQLYSAADPAGMIPNMNWTTYTKGGPALSNHSSCDASGIATAWEDAAFYGNGLLGGLVLVDAQDPKHTLRLQLGRTDVADHRDAGSPFATGALMFDKPRLPVGSLGLTTKGAITAGEFRVHLANGTVTGHLNTTLGTVDFALLAHYTRLAIVLQWNATAGEAPDPRTGDGGTRLEFVALPGNSTRHTPPSNYKCNPLPDCRGSPWGGSTQVCTQELLVGGNYATALQTQPLANGLSGVGEVEVSLLTILHIANDWPMATSPTTSAAVVAGLFSAVHTSGLAGLVAEHNAWWADYWPASFLSIPDTTMEAMALLQQYKYASAARPGGPAIDLMGPWWQQSGWELYWWDMNVPVTYWATYAARRFGVAGTLSWWLSAHLDVMRQNVVVPPATHTPSNFTEFDPVTAFGLKSTVPPGSSNISGAIGFGSITSFDMKAPMLIAPNQQLGNPTWIAVNLYQHASFTANTTMLRDLVFPFLRGTVNIYLAFSVNGSDGRIHLPPTASPEYPYPRGPANDTNFDLMLFMWGARTLLRLAEELDIADPLVPRWKDVVARLTPFPVNEYGYMVDSVNGFNIPHRHFSHLFAIYPLHLTTWDDADGGTPASRALILASVDRWTGLTCTGGPGKDLCPNGFTFDGAASMSALIANRGSAAAGNVTGFMVSGEMHAATLYSEGRQPCLESPPGAANALQEMLIQSWGGRVRIFPGIPAAWTDAVIHRMGAEGGFAVSAVRTAGSTSWVAVEAVDYTGSGGPARSVVLLAEGFGPAAKIGTEPAGVTVTDAEGGALAFHVNLGGTVVLFLAGQRPAQFVVSQLPGDPSKFNFWGKH